jgi:hypothetical protein
MSFSEWPREGSDMTMTDKGEILEEIGRLVDDQLNGNSENCLSLCGNCRRIWAKPIFWRTAGDRMIFHVADMEIFWAAMALWELEPERQSLASDALFDGRREVHGGI